MTWSVVGVSGSAGGQWAVLAVGGSVTPAAAPTASWAVLAVSGTATPSGGSWAVAAVTGTVTAGGGTWQVAGVRGTIEPGSDPDEYYYRDGTQLYPLALYWYEGDTLTPI